MPELKIYTVAQIREWLEQNKPAEGLSEQVIAPTRAWAIIHNPYVKEEDAIVAAIFEDGQLAAYTASFPDILDGQRVWWASTLYCYPQYAGRGYGMIVVGSLMEAHEPDMTYDRWGALETVEIFNHYGYQTTYTLRYYLSDGKIDTSSPKGKLAYCAQELKKSLHPWPKQSNANYTLRYASYIDGEAYAFMKAHRGMNLWIKEQEMLNWILRYPFAQTSPIKAHAANDCVFTSFESSYSYLVMKVYDETNLVGVVVLRYFASSISVLYLYLEEKQKELVYTAITDHIIQNKPHTFITENIDCINFVRQRLYFPKMQEKSISISLPDSVELPIGCTMQMGDGDSFA